MKTFSTIFTLFLLITFMSTLTAQVNWTKDSTNNPVLQPGLPGEWDDYSLFPISILFDGIIYHMWYGGHDGAYPRIGYATSPDGITWTKYAGNPVLDIGEPGSWEDDRVQSPYVLFDGNTYHMWYIGQNSGIGYNRIGYATSTDRVTWTKYEGNPVLDVSPEGTWQIRGYDAPCIIFDGSIYHMWYHAWVPDLYLICYATSPDGITWTKYAGNPVLDIGSNGSWDSYKVLAPDVFFDGKTYHMWYTGNATDWEDCIGYATSADGINWTKFTGNPVLKMSKAGEWDSKYICRCRVLKDTATSTYKMWYGGGVIDYQAVSFGYATSPDILDVPGDFETIQSAIDTAQNGDIVLVAENTYYENINFKGKAITVASHFYLDGDTNHINNTIIDGNYNGSVVKFENGEDSTAMLSGFMVTHGLTHLPSSAGGGIFVENSSPVIEYCHIIDNKALVGAGIYLSNSNARFDHVYVKSNHTTRMMEVGGAGGGFFIDSSSPILSNMDIVDNYAQDGGGICCWESVLILINAKLLDNGATIQGMGGNHGGGLLAASTDMTLDNVTLSNNISAGEGGGIQSWNSQIYLRNVTIKNNHAFRGGGILISPYPHSPPGLELNFDDINRCNIYNNTATEFGHDLFNESDSIIHVVVDTFTVMNPDSTHAYPLDRFTFDILHDTLGNPNKIKITNNIPLEFTLSQNYPNPFNPVTIINYQLPMTSDVELSIYNLLGQKVATLVNERKRAGYHQVEWDASNMASGVYLYRLKAEGYVETKKMIILR